MADDRRLLTGQPASRGLASGTARIIYPLRFEVDETPITPDEIGGELARVATAFDRVGAELMRLRRRLHGALKRELAEFIDAHALILDDPEFRGGIEEHIRRQHLRATAALKLHRDRLIGLFDKIDDPYLRSRGEDVDQVVARVYAALRRAEGSAPRGQSTLPGTVLVCESLGPAELDYWHEHGLAAVIMSAGSTFSHSAILARSLGVPMLIGCAGALDVLHEGDVLLVRADAGEVIARPDAIDLARHRDELRQAEQGARRRARLRGAATVTRDGAELHLWANAETVGDIAKARRLGVEGIGLYRSELVFLRHDGVPSEEMQFRAYREAVLAMAGRPVTLRTLDVGADKPGAGALDVGDEPNPALGLRGIRLTLARREIFASQLRAMLRAAAYGPIRILLPMVTVPSEIAATRALIDECRAQLRGAGVETPESVPVGAMIEVPAAALMADAIAHDSDFLALGSNDLVQYTLASDRNNGAVRALYDPLHPAVVRLLDVTVQAAQRARVPLSLCGEMAGDVAYLPLLLALGLREFSMHPNAILDVRERAAGLSRKALRARRAKLLRAATRDDVLAALGGA